MCLVLRLRADGVEQFDGAVEVLAAFEVERSSSHRAVLVKRDLLRARIDLPEDAVHRLIALERLFLIAAFEIDAGGEATHGDILWRILDQLFDGCDG